MRFWGKGDTRQVAKWDTVFSLTYTTDTSELMRFLPKNPDIARPNHLVRGLQGRMSLPTLKLSLVWGEAGEAKGLF